MLAIQPYFYGVLPVSLNYYESIVALASSVEESAQKDFFKKVKKTIESFSGSLHHIDILGSRPLANTAQKKPHKRALYFHFSYQSEAACVAEINRIFRIQDYVLYFHQEKLDKRIPLDQHQQNFETILQNANENEESRMARIQLKKKKIAPPEAPVSPEESSV